MSKTMKDPLHTTLRRQLRQLQLTDAEAPISRDQWREFLFSVDRAYREADELAYLVSAGEGLAGSPQTLTPSPQRLDGLANWICDLDTGLVAFSEELSTLLGINGGAPAKLAIEQMLDYVYPADRQAAVQMLRNASGSATSRTTEIRFMTTGGVERRCLCRLASFANDSGKVVRIEGTVLDVSERRAAEERTRRAGRADPLTGFANREQFMSALGSALDECRATNGRAGVALVDIDGFKAVNESCGRAIGGALLEAVARRLRGCLRGSDMLARFGDNEFVLLLKDVGNDERLKQIIARVLEACSTSVASGEGPINVSANVGVALFPADGEDASRLMQGADAARHAANLAGRNNVRHFSDEVRARRDADRALAGSLRTAISRGDISVAYQPIVDGETLRIVGAEALARWSHPTLGPVSPAEFVQLAEQNGMIGELSSHVIREACGRLSKLPASLASRHLAVNLSLVQLRSPVFVDQLQAMLEQCRVDPSRLRLEVAESAIMEDRDQAVRSLTRLRDLGMSIWLDDFGAVHSSIAGLRKVPIDGIKIDRSLVSAIQGSTANEVLQDVIAIARSLGCEVIAEGVETRRQRAALLQAGCRMMQGYLFGAPDTFERWHPRDAAQPRTDAALAGH